MHNHHPRLIDSVRRLSSGAIRLYRARLELAMVELREEIERTRQKVVVLVVMAVLALMGLALVDALLVVMLIPAIGLAGSLAVFAFLHLAGVAGLFLWIRSRWKDEPELFAYTLREFEKDCEQLCDVLEPFNSEPAESRSRSSSETVP